jgi:Uma2 family endonuclease
MAEPTTQTDVLTYAEAKAIEDASDERHVLWDGVLYAMAGASLAHYRIEQQLTVALAAALAGAPCEVFTGNARLRPLHTDRFFYADASVFCEPPILDTEDSNALTNPTAVFEVLSPSTERFDRTEKFAVYREMPSVQLIVFLRSDVVSIYRYERAAGGWVLTTFGPSEQVPLLHGTFAVDDVYRGVHFSPLPRLL